MDADKIAAARSKRHAHATLNFASGEMQRADRYNGTRGYNRKLD
jgi:hypothetical protein